MIQSLGQPVVVFAFAAACLFMVGYTILAPWWRTTTGRARISLDFGIALALSPTVLHLTFGVTVTNAFFGWYTLIAIAIVGCVSLWNLYLVIATQLKAARDQ